MSNKTKEKRKVKQQVVENTMIYLLPKILFIVIFMGVLISSWFFVDWLYQPDSFPIKQVKLENQLKNQKSKELQVIASKAVNGGFFSLDIDKFRSELLFSLPWVEEVRVRKVWPDKLLVSIKEHQPISRWVSIDKLQKNPEYSQNDIELLSRNGVVFYPKLTDKQTKKFNRMAVLSGPEMNAKIILETCVKINKSLKKLNSRVQQCGMNGRRSWLITLNNGIVIKLGKENVMQNLHQYIDVFSDQLSKYFDQVDYADLRFSNGFSVKWKVTNDESNMQTNNGDRQGI